MHFAAHLWMPFLDFVFMRRALIGGLVLACKNRWPAKSPWMFHAVVACRSCPNNSTSTASFPSVCKSWWPPGSGAANSTRNSAVNALKP